jgi:GNAT superfamily N-acetyltransferase
VNARPGDVEIRRSSTDDRRGILELARRTLGWGSNDEAFFRWKHLENPFGESPMWVACSTGRIVGFRTFLRWRFTKNDHQTVHAVRAVDTATDPAFQGRGIFRDLTLHALKELEAEGVNLVFNTPNSKSMPGYLTMGWHIVGRPRVHVVPTGARSLLRIAQARVPASLNPVEMRVGERPADVLGDRAPVSRLLERVAPKGIATTRTPEYLTWRYGFAPLHYRVVTHTSSIEDGLAVFHLRRRGGAIEATVCDVLVPAGDKRAERELTRRIASLTKADYLLRLDRRRFVPGAIPVPKAGPVLTMRSIDGRPLPRTSDLALTMGDIELL